MNMLLSFRKSLVTFQSQVDGNSLIETALVMPLLVLLLAGTVDMGRAFRAAMIVNGAARTGAAYGIHYPTDVTGMIAAAKSDSSSLITVTPTAQYGCQCADGTADTCGSTSSCPTAMNSVYYVQVNTTGTYTPLIPWPGIPTAITLTAQVKLRAAR